MHIHRIKNGEDIYDLSREYGISPIKIAEHNDISTRTHLGDGREILILVPNRTYNVKASDTTDMIARKFNTKSESLLRMNPELKGVGKLYNGQQLTVKSEGERYGMISTNGYYYRGTRKERLISILPYLSYVTVCSALYKDNVIHTMLDASDAVNTVCKRGKAVLVRIYMSEMPSGRDIKSFTDSAVILAKSGGFSGVTLSSLGSMRADNDEKSKFILNVRKEMMANDLLLFAEGDSEYDCSYIEYADAGVITYDKLHKDSIPSFEDGEFKTYEKLADELDSSKLFMELSSFAYCGGKYIDKKEAIDISDKRRAEYTYNSEEKTVSAVFGKNKKHKMLCESLENTKAKLEMISELGFMGISFDIARVCIPDLMIMSTMFGVIEKPAYITGYKSDIDCKGNKRED